MLPRTGARADEPGDDLALVLLHRRIEWGLA
jgi:hypothetical protein